MRLGVKQRSFIIAAARSWLGTPYHHRAALRGAGADCAMFPLAIYRECGLIPATYQPPEYSSQWHLHRSEELYLAEVQKFASESSEEPRPADFVVFKFGRTFSHGAIVIEWPLVIHSYIPHGVTLADAMRDGQLVGRARKVFGVCAPGNIRGNNEIVSAICYAAGSRTGAEENEKTYLTTEDTKDHEGLIPAK
jgi:cell wall-associated NlpC family hydrolase